jgi:hypothetical protein
MHDDHFNYITKLGILKKNLNKRKGKKKALG